VWRSLLVLAAAACGRSGFEQHPLIEASVIDAPRTYRDAVLASQPLAYWRFDDSDTMVRDEVGGAPGSFTGGCTVGAAGAIAGDADPALTLDGTCRILLGSGFEFDGNAPYAIEVWIHTSLNTIYQQVFGRETRDTQDPIDGYELVVAPVGLQIERAIATANNKTPVVTFATDRFIYVVAQYTGTTQEVWVDGVQVGQSIDTRMALANDAPALAGASTMGNYFTGGLDELAVYGRALDASEIELHHTLGTN
jgi:concanavalin A-like lectin/glucanase superfamily protein